MTNKAHSPHLAPLDDELPDFGTGDSPLERNFGAHPNLRIPTQNIPQTVADARRALFQELLKLAVDGGWPSARVVGTYTSLTGSSPCPGWYTDQPAASVSADTRRRVEKVHVREEGSISLAVLLALVCGLIGGALMTLGWTQDSQTLMIAGALSPAALLIVLAGVAKMELF